MALGHVSHASLLGGKDQLKYRASLPHKSWHRTVAHLYSQMIIVEIQRRWQRGPKQNLEIRQNQARAVALDRLLHLDFELPRVFSITYEQPFNVLTRENACAKVGAAHPFSCCALAPQRSCNDDLCCVIDFALL